jgi:hypothetical protein
LPLFADISLPSACAHDRYRGYIAFTIATMPARIASGSASQRSATSAKSGDFRAKSAKQDAKTSGTISGLASEDEDELEVTSGRGGSENWF